MANVFTNIMPKIIARGLMVLREVAIMPRLVNSDFSADAKRKGQTVDVPVPSAVGTQAVSPGKDPVTPVDTTVPIVQIPLDQWRKNDPIYLTDKEMLEIDSKEFFLPTQMEEAVRALANEVNVYLFGLYKNTTQGIYGAVGTAGTTPFGSGVLTKSATDARKLLNKQLCPKANRSGVLDYDAEAAALELSAFQDADKVGSSEVKIEGEVGRKFGINWNADGDVPTHTAGTIVDGGAARTCAVDNGAGYAIGIDTIDVDEGAATTAVGTITRGDIISFAGHAQQYVVVDNTGSAQFVAPDYTFATNAIAGLKFYPALVAAVVDDELITVVDDHVVNLCFHRDAFGFAQRQLETDSIGTQIITMTDPVTGIGLRLEVLRQNKQMVWEFDLLYGGKLVRPELAVRIMG